MTDGTPRDSSEVPQRRPWLLLILLAYAVAFARAVGFSMVWDDQQLSNDGVFSMPLSKLIFAPQQALLDASALDTQNAQTTYDSFRPLATLSHVIDIRFFGGAPAAMHAQNLLLGAVAILLAFVLTRRVLGEPRALISCAVFALHPLQVESIAYISARGDLLAGCFALAAVWCAIETFEVASSTMKRILVVLTGVAFFASLCSKEAYAGAPIVMLCLAFARGKLRDAFAPIAACTLGLGLYVALRVHAMSGSSMNAGHAPWFALLAWPGVTVEYAGTFLLPVDLSIGRVFDPRCVGLGGIALLVIGAVLVSCAHSKKARAMSMPALIGIACALAALGPASVAVTENRVFADRYAFLAVLPFTFLLLSFHDLVATRLTRPILTGTFVLWACALLFIHVGQLDSFRDNWALYDHDLNQQPQSAAASYRVGYLLARKGDLRAARAYFERSIELDPRDIKARSNLGVVLMSLGELPAAQSQIEAAISLAPKLNYRAWYNLAQVRKLRGDPSGACQALMQSRAINPSYQKAKAAEPALCGSVAP